MTGEEIVVSRGKRHHLEMVASIALDGQRREIGFYEGSAPLRLGLGAGVRGEVGLGSALRSGMGPYTTSQLTAARSR